MKILCLHGFRHNSDKLKKSMDPIIRKLEKTEYNIDFDFFDSPIPYGCDDDPNNELRKWWTVTRENINIEHYDTCNDSLQTLFDKWQSDEYDGLLGFSQGSVLIQIFAYQIQMGILAAREPKFIILCSTSKISDTHFATYYDQPLEYKTLIISGSRDPLVNIEDVIALRKNFENHQIIIHSGGHYVSSNSETYYQLKKFLTQ